MNWLNLNIQTLDSEEFVGCDPVDRATWICLLRYCIGQENGGVISDCAGWPDRKWQQLVRITKDEVSRQCDLWHNGGESITVWGYPNDKEAEVKTKREIAKTNGAKGGRPPKTDDGLPKEPTLVKSVKAERKGKERNKKGKECQSKMTLAEIIEFVTTIGLPESDGVATFHKWEGNGWTNGGKPIKDCKATIRSWKAAGYLPSQKEMKFKNLTPQGVRPINEGNGMLRPLND